MTPSLAIAALAGLAGLAAMPAALHAVAPQEVRRPNVIFILTDDQGMGDLGCYGNALVATPNVDRLAAEGVRLTSFYAGSPVCSPSRAALLTGAYPSRSGITRALSHEALEGLDPSLPTLAKQFKRAGYATGIIGKWHLGKGLAYSPLRHGFDSFFGTLSTNNGYVIAEEVTPERISPDCVWHDAASAESIRGDAGKKLNTRFPFVRDDQIVEYPADTTTLTERYTQEALQFIRRHRDEPFFLYLPHSMPHYPVRVSDAFRGRSRQRSGPDGIYGDVTEALDWSTGQIMHALKEAGLERDTILVYTSDNGAAEPSSRYYTGASNGPLRGSKNGAYEGGHRVPCIVWAPGRLPAGRTVDHIVTMMDFYPTLAGQAGFALPAGHTLDGVDAWPALQGQNAVEPRSYFYLAGDTYRAVRHGRWKLHQGRTTELFDLQSDVGETTNLAAEHPERVRELEQRLTAARQTLIPHQKEMK
jgi:arylsulfatase A